MKEIKVEGYPDLVRDCSSGAIVNKNHSEYEKYIAVQKKRESEKNKMKSIEEDLSSLKGELDEIKSLLHQLISK